MLDRLSFLPGQYFGGEKIVDQLTGGLAVPPTCPTFFWLEEVVDKLIVRQAFPPTWPIFWMGGGSGGGRQA